MGGPYISRKLRTPIVQHNHRNIFTNQWETAAVLAVNLDYLPSNLHMENVYTHKNYAQICLKNSRTKI